MISHSIHLGNFLGKRTILSFEFITPLSYVKDQFLLPVVFVKDNVFSILLAIIHKYLPVFVEKAYILGAL